jgi:hypothetical protein
MSLDLLNSYITNELDNLPPSPPCSANSVSNNGFPFHTDFQPNLPVNSSSFSPMRPGQHRQRDYNSTIIDKGTLANRCRFVNTLADDMGLTECSRAELQSYSTVST